MCRGLCPQTPTRAVPLDPLGDFCPQYSSFVPLRNKFLATPLAVAGNNCRVDSCLTLCNPAEFSTFEASQLFNQYI